MSFKDLDPELLENVASVGGEYGRKIERYMEEIKRLRKIEKYLRKRLLRKGKPQPLTLKLMVKTKRLIEFNKKEALKYRYYLIIYRESLGLINHRSVFEIYNIEKL